MLASLMAAFRIPDLKKRITFLFAMFAVYELGLHISVPGVNTEALGKIFGGDSNNLFSLFDAFTGGAFKRYTILAMGIMPYINASIIMQLLTIAFPPLEALQKEGAAGQKKIRLYTRWLTGGLALFQAYGTTLLLKSAGAIPGATSFWTVLHIAIVLVAGTSFLMYLGEMISDKGIGNGVSLVIFAGIVAVLPAQIATTVRVEGVANGRWIQVFILGLLFIATVAFVVAITQAQRKIPIQHVKRIVGNKMVGGSSSFLPLKINSAGVIPIIFAVSIMYFPMTAVNILQQWFNLSKEGIAYKFASGVMPGNSWWGSLSYAVLIIFFTYFYTAVTFNVKEVAENLKKWGSFIPGIRPGKPTQDYLDKIMTRITLSGAVFLAVIALLQYLVPNWLNVHSFSLIGGTSLLIVVGVALETMQAIESHLLMRHYEGFIK